MNTITYNNIEYDVVEDANDDTACYYVDGELIVTASACMMTNQVNVERHECGSVETVEMDDIDRDNPIEGHRTILAAVLS